MTVLIGQKEGLPNITGSFYGSGLTSDSGTSIGNGSLYKIDQSTVYAGSRTTALGGVAIGLDASKLNSIYGASSHVQPINLTVRYWERTA